MVAAASFALHGIDHGFDDTKSHPHPNNAERIPEAAVKHQVAHIPNPFKTKW